MSIFCCHHQRHHSQLHKQSQCNNNWIDDVDNDVILGMWNLVFIRSHETYLLTYIAIVTSVYDIAVTFRMNNLSKIVININRAIKTYLLVPTALERKISQSTMLYNTNIFRRTYHIWSEHVMNEHLEYNNTQLWRIKMFLFVLYALCH